MKNANTDCPTHLFCTQALVVLLIIATVLLTIHSEPLQSFFASLIEVGNKDMMRQGLTAR